MFYWFQRGSDLMRYEARTLLDAYELVIVAPDGSETIEHFGNSEALRQREEELVERLHEEGWQGPHGWNL
jgi:hypothetical protein